MKCCDPTVSGHRAWHIAGRILLGAVFALVLAAAFGLAVQYLWNHVLVALFRVPVLRYCQAVGLLLLARLLVGGFGHGHGHGHGRRCGRGFGHRHGWCHRLGPQDVDQPAGTPPART
jgi:hypothetical protein